MDKATTTKRKAKLKVTERAFRFLRGAPGDINLVEDNKINLLAQCIVWQQRAGFGDCIDLRQAPCPNCKSPGFNTGFGYFQFVCGAEVLSDGEQCKPCIPRLIEPT